MGFGELDAQFIINKVVDKIHQAPITNNKIRSKELHTLITQIRLTNDDVPIIMDILEQMGYIKRNGKNVKIL